MNINPDFADFISLLNKHSVEYLVVGGYAVGLHGLPRYTGDLDIWVNKSDENLKKLKTVIAEFGGPLADIDFGKLTQEPTPTNPVPGIGFGREPMRIEILSALAGIKFSESFEKAQTVTINSIEIKYIHYNDLKIAKQLSGRPRDIADINELDQIRRSKEQ